MGNQREIRQVNPLRYPGAILRVRSDALLETQRIFENLNDRFYTRVESANGTIGFPNLDGPDTIVEGLVGDFITIQSGGKMWCGYENFTQHISELASLVDDALFYVGDENGDIDMFLIANGALRFKRVYSGPRLTLEDYLELSA